jgi:hypothetical protein
MKSRITYCLMILLTGVFFLALSSELTAQTMNPEIMMKFQRNSDGKVVVINAVGQKVYNFSVSGLVTTPDVDNFKNKFIGRSMVVSISVDAAVSNGDRTGTIIMERGTKVSYTRDLLIKAGILNIMIDGAIKPVEEIGKDK